MNKHYFAAALMAMGLNSAQAGWLPERDGGVMQQIAAQGNAALVEIRAQARASLLAQRPALPARSVSASAQFTALRAGGAILPTTWRCAK